MFFSLYEGPFEKKVDKFLRKINKRSAQDLELLMQEDLVRLTIFMEYKFKGYKKLRKRYRKKLYESAELIKKNFSEFYEENSGRIAVQKTKSDIPDHLLADEHFKYLLVIMNYLTPGKRLEYRESATFEKLLRDPSVQKLVGDCNQITTLYIYLFSLRYPIHELQVKILPKHICLHYKGVDIETTTGKLAHYEDYTFLSSVTEIVPSNILDVADPDEKQFKISPGSMLKAAEFAFAFSGHRQTVEKNLFTAYHNTAIYYAKNNNFKQAVLFANKSGNTKLQQSIVRNEAVYLLRNKKFNKAAGKFKKIGDIAGEKTCYQNELVQLFTQIKGFNSLDQYKSNKSVLRRIKELALKTEDRKVLDFVNGILKKL